MDFKNILIFRTGHLGDTLVALPAYWALRKTFPEARLTLLSNANSSSQNYVLAQNVLPETGLFDDWMMYPAKDSKIENFQSFARLMLNIAQRKFDAVVYLMTRNRIPSQIKRDKLFFRLCGIRNIIGTEYLMQNYLDPQTSAPLPRVEPEFEYLLNCLRFEGLFVDPENVLCDLLLTDAEIISAEQWIKGSCSSNPELKRLIAVAPGSKWDSKIWSEERFYEVISKLIVERNVFPIIFGGEEDREKGDRLIKRWGKGANAAGKLNLREAAAAIEKCQLYVGNDTGTMHLAASVKTPCVGVFAAIDWENRWTPYGNNHQIIRKKVPCEGCLSPFSFYNNKCLDLIDVKEVYEACVNVIDNVGKTLDNTLKQSVQVLP